MELITIGCKLAHGIWLEVGLEHTPGVWGASVRGPKYVRVLLNGTHAEWQKKAPTIQPVATLNPEPGLTQIPKDVWEAWCQGMGKTHPARLNSMIFVVPKDTGAAKDVLQAAKDSRSGYEPIDPNRLPSQILEAPVDGRPQLGKAPVRKD